MCNFRSKVEENDTRHFAFKHSTEEENDKTQCGHMVLEPTIFELQGGVLHHLM